MSTPDPTPTPLPAAPDWRALCQELHDALDSVFQVMAGEAGTDHINTATNVLLRVDAALATPPAVDADERLRLVTAGVRSGYTAGHDATVEGHYGDPEEVAADMAPVVLAEAGPAPPAATREAGPQAGAEISDEELRAIGDTIMGYVADPVDSQEMVEYGRAVWNRAALARWGGAAVPVPVSERLPGPEDCDAEGRCWFFISSLGGYDDDWGWKLLDRTYGASQCQTTWMPHRALSLPVADAEEAKGND
jgi:hypothetical protein